MAVKKKIEIDKDMTLQEVVSKYPKTVEVLLSKGLHCIGCPMAGSETLEQAAKSHNLDLKKLIKDLEKVC